MNEIDYEKLADAIANKLRLLPPPDKIIWEAEQCAQYLRVSERHYVDRLSKSYGFPSPIKLPSEKGKGHARWYAKDIQDWVLKQKQTG